MVEMNNKNRIIGDFLEINSNILEYQMSGKNFLDKFYKKIKSKRYRKKLLNAARKLKDSNYVLNIHNVAELFCTTFNNYPPKGNFGHVFYSKINNGDNDLINGIIQYGKLEDNLQAVFVINLKENKMEITINNSDYNEENNYYIELTEMKTENKQTKVIVETINRLMLETISDYIEEIVSKFV